MMVVLFNNSFNHWLLLILELFNLQVLTFHLFFMFLNLLVQPLLVCGVICLSSLEIFLECCGLVLPSFDSHSVLQFCLYGSLLVFILHLLESLLVVSGDPLDKLVVLFFDFGQLVLVEGLSFG